MTMHEEERQRAFIEEQSVESALPDAALYLLAGLALEQGLADKKTARRWREAVIDKRWQARDCAREVLASGTVDPVDGRLEERAARLLRDFLMAPMQQGVRGAARRGRERARSGCAMVLSQGLAFVIFTIVASAIAVLLRMKGHSLDGWADWVLGLF